MAGRKFRTRPASNAPLNLLPTDLPKKLPPSALTQPAHDCLFEQVSQEEEEQDPSRVDGCAHHRRFASRWADALAMPALRSRTASPMHSVANVHCAQSALAATDGCLWRRSAANPARDRLAADRGRVGGTRDRRRRPPRRQRRVLAADPGRGLWRAALPWRRGALRGQRHRPAHRLPVADRRAGDHRRPPLQRLRGGAHRLRDSRRGPPGALLLTSSPPPLPPLLLSSSPRRLLPSPPPPHLSSASSPPPPPRLLFASCSSRCARRRGRTRSRRRRWTRGTVASGATAARTEALAAAAAAALSREGAAAWQGWVCLVCVRE